MGDTKPKWGYEICSKNVDWNDEKKKKIISSIERVTNLTFTEDLATRLIGELKKYFYNKDIDNNYPGPSNARPALKKLNKSAIELLQILTDLDPTSRHYLKKQSDWVDIAKTTHYVKIITLASEDALKSLPAAKKGAPKGIRDVALHELIIELVNIYQEMTGSKPTIAQKPIENLFYGPFFGFVFTCLEKIGCAPHSNNSLGSAIQRVLSSLN